MLGSTLPAGGGVRLAVGAQRHEVVLVHDRVARLVVFRRAGAVGAAEDPDHVRRRLQFLHALGQLALPARPGDGVGLGLVPRCPRAGHLEHIGPAVEHRHQEVAVAHVRQAQDVRLLREVEPGGRVERVGVRGGDVAELGVGVRPACAGTDPSGRGCPSGFGRVGHHAPGVFHRHERVAVDVGIGRDLNGFVTRWNLGPGFRCAGSKRGRDGQRGNQTERNHGCLSSLRMDS